MSTYNAVLKASYACEMGPKCMDPTPNVSVYIYHLPN